MVFHIFSKEEVDISCCNCKKHYKAKRPRAINKNKFEKGHWEAHSLKEDINSIYLYKHSEVLSSKCPECGSINYIFLNKDMEVEVSKEKPENTLVAKKLIEHWIEKG